MSILDNTIILTLIALAFVAGKAVSDRYYSGIIEEFRYLLRLQEAKEGVGYIAPPVRHQRYRFRDVVGQDFAERLRTYGKATKQINP
jgi:hypothetical protein